MKKIIVTVAVICFVTGPLEHSDLDLVQAAQPSNNSDARNKPGIVFSGPWQKGPAETPRHFDFPLFAVPVPDIISRSGQPTLLGFRWLKDHGWKGIVDLRVAGEGGSTSNDIKIPGFKELDFNYLELPIADGSVPSDTQAQEFLEFVTNPLHQPVHVHCRAGIGRTGVMMALYHYQIQGWPMEEAIRESRLFSGGVSETQKKWLEQWAQAHKPGVK